ncbi:MAG: SpoIIE family protein phosphatase [Clostridiales bacterium]|jgi:serine/threonine protein phosphatase PrpC|nr:SpoIIE family protein phosphatase [Clostridiales bacterium]
MKNANKKIFIYLKYPLFFALFFTLFHAKSALDFSPFAVGAFAALVYCRQNIVTVTPVYILASLTADFTAASFLLASVPAVLFFCLYFILFRLKKKPGTLYICVAAAIGCSPMFLFADGEAQFVNAVVTLILSVFSTYAFSVLFSAFLVRRAISPYRLTTDEKASLCLLAAALSLGIIGIKNFGPFLWYFTSVFFIVSALRIFGAKEALIPTVVMGLGSVFYSFDTTNAAYIVIIAAAAISLSPISAYLSPIGAIIAYLLVSVGEFSPARLIITAAIALGAASATLIPKKAFAPFFALNAKNGGDSKFPIARSLVNNSRAAYARKLNGLEKAFYEMTSLLLSFASSEKKSADTPHMLLAAQFGGVADIFKNLAADFSNEISFDASAEKNITEALAEKNIVCREAAVYGEGDDINVFVIVRERDMANPALAKTLSSVVKQKLTPISVDIPYEGFAAAEYGAANRFDVVYGEAYRSQENVSGDVKLAMRINGDKFIVALSDGMGHGSAAERASENAIRLIENFYRAGFTDEALLYLVNHVLCNTNNEIFASLDTCIIDLKKGSAGFIKMGANDGYICRKNGTEIIESKTPPLGVFDEAFPVMTEKFLMPDDFVIMVSDGIGEAFYNDGLKEFISSSKTKNPQTLADSILSKAMEYGVKDDLSVIVLRIFKAL